MSTNVKKSITNTEDKRILKTKQNLKLTLVRLLAQERFESITVTQLCKEALTSRITFYAHYDDKYDLADDLFGDMIGLTQRRLDQLESSGNPDHDIVLSYEHLLTCILELYEENYAFFSHATAEENPYLHYSFYRRILSALEEHTVATLERSGGLLPRYELGRTIAFICNGLWAFISEARGQGASAVEVTLQARGLLHDLLQSNILTQPKGSAPKIPKAIGKPLVASAEANPQPT